MNCPNVMVVKAPSGMGAPTGRTDCVLRLKIPGMVLVKALAASVLRPSPGGPMEAPSRKCCQMGWVSQYRPPPARMTVLPLLRREIQFVGLRGAQSGCHSLAVHDRRQILREREVGIKKAGLQVVSKAQVD